MYNKPLMLDAATMVEPSANPYIGDSAIKRIKRLTRQATIVSEALERTALRFSLVKHEKRKLRVA